MTRATLTQTTPAAAQRSGVAVRAGNPNRMHTLNAQGWHNQPKHQR